MSFEQLPDELLLIICSYLTPYHIIKSLNDLNTRLNSTIAQYRQNLDFRELNFREFNFFCKSIRSSFGEQIRSIILSNAAPSVRQLIYFRKQISSFETILPNLERLTLIDHYDNELDLYLPIISSFKYLKELKINFIKNKNETTLMNLIPQILTDNLIYFDHQPKRRKRDFNFSLEKLSFTDTGYLKLTPLFNQTIKHLTIEIENTDDLLQIFSGFLSLEYLNVNLKQLTAIYDVLHHERDIQCLSLVDFRCQVRWQPDKLSFNEFTLIMKRMRNLQHFSCTLMTEINRDKLIESDYLNLEKWTNFSHLFPHLINLNCFIKCPLKSPACLENDFVGIIAKISRTIDRTIDIQHYQTNNIIRSEATLELDIQELHKTNASQLAGKLMRTQELTLYSDFFVDDERIFSTFPDSLLLSDRLTFSRIRSLDLLGEFPNLNNTFLIKFVEQLLRRSPNLQSIGFFLYWVENMTDLVLDFLRPLKSDLKQIKKCYLYTEGDIDEKFVSELACLLPSLTLLSVKIDWYCNTAEVINFILEHMKDLNHLEIVLEDIPDYLDEDYIDRIKIEKDIESLSMARDTREWLKRNTILGKRTFNKIFQAEKNENDLKIWL